MRTERIRDKTPDRPRTKRGITDFIFSASGIEVYWSGPGSRIQLLFSSGGLSFIDSAPDPIMTLKEAREAATAFIASVLATR